MHVERLDHLVLTVRDVEATVAFYERALGMREAQHFADQRTFPGLESWELEYRAKLV
jgi:catechol 2,3-dioxygenase-like lactoylglutathione lyase family enzyme